MTCIYLIMLFKHVACVVLVGIGDPLVACCGGNGPYHTSMECNGTAKLWGDPHHFANWDGMHMTEKAYNIIVEGVLNGPFADPPFSLSC
jgi:hypothetical protein